MYTCSIEEAFSSFTQLTDLTCRTSLKKSLEFSSEGMNDIGDLGHCSSYMVIIFFWPLSHIIPHKLKSFYMN